MNNKKMIMHFDYLIINLIWKQGRTKLIHFYKKSVCRLNTEKIAHVEIIDSKTFGYVFEKNE